MQLALEIRSNSGSITLRPPHEGDSEVMASIYNAEIGAGVSHYDELPQTSQDRVEWLRNLERRKLPVVVAQHGFGVVGFGALTPFHGATGYRHTVTTTMYIAKDFRNSGIGRAMASFLIEQAKRMSVHAVVAGISADNVACLKFIETLGFQKVGVFREIGFRNDRWVDDICFQLLLDSLMENER